jgi:tRNA pseudouridine38-40 synthase
LREARLNDAPPPSDERTVRLTAEYDGTHFAGFQWQPLQRTVAGVLEAALSSLLRDTVKVPAAGRTDAGVHATGQVLSFRTRREFPFERLALALPSLLPADVSVRDPAVETAGFSARFSARERTYVCALSSRRRSALSSRYVYCVGRPLDVATLRRAARHLIGERDFRSFCGMLPDNGRTVRDLRRIDVEALGDLIRIEIAADGFLHHMVRTMVGTLVECAVGRRSSGDIGAIFDARDRRAAGHTAPAHGLYLAGVRYDGYDSYCAPPIVR